MIAVSYERIHRSNLVGMGVLPLQFKEGEDADSLGLTGFEKFNIDTKDLKIKGELNVTTNTGKTFSVIVRIDTEPEMNYYRAGGILLHVLKKMVKN